ncbi:MAG: protease inhibitor I42 family protein [Anaerolineales bacterium]|nr:protease inhibitor I42 family protein [Anaerolineales bacterium]
MKKLFLFILTAILLTACSSKVEPQPEDLVVSDPAKNIEAIVGGEFKIVLDSNPSTGYHWELGEDMDESIVQFVSKGYNAGGLSAPGSGGRDAWIFKALQAGETHITLLYYPPSNEPVEPQQKVTFTVTVK